MISSDQISVFYMRLVLVFVQLTQLVHKVLKTILETDT